MEIEKSPKSLFHKNIKKYMQSEFSAKKSNDCKRLQTHFSTFVFQTLSHKNENWTFLKMSKSLKSLRKFGIKKHV